ncbi:class Ib ribonucleoside-diphosphate reductase assembly flavoprotein NrdI [Bacillus sp. SCS-151]|uniref:class Ib ribonucleoside-diphosphate reductase assembly flavoprotein NrdI n=1 Tax=Nanhaiella sioensis TaxID=3115293 RepID=UPI00397A2C10
MLIVYDTLTGNVERFVSKLIEINCIKIKKNMSIKEPFILVTYTTGFGQIPESTVDFLKHNHKWLKGVASSGNLNWGKYFGNAAKLISDKFNVPLILKFELSGTEQDIDKFIQEVNRIEKHVNTKMDTIK